MARDLPSIPDVIPQVRAPQGISPSQIAQPYMELAEMFEHRGRALEKVGDTVMEDVAVPAAREAGAQAVTRDANGNVQIDKWPVFGRAADVYRDNLEMAALSDFENDAKLKSIAIAQENREDPQAYLKAMGEYRDARTKYVAGQVGPHVAMKLGALIDQNATQTFLGLTNTKQRVTDAKNEASFNIGIESATNDLNSFVRGGGDPKSEYAYGLVGKILALQQRKMEAPNSTYTADQQREDIQRVTSNAQGEAYLYKTLKDYQDAPDKGTAAAAALSNAQSILKDDPRYKGLKITEKEAFWHKAVGEIRAQEAIRKGDIQEARRAEQEMVAASNLGQRIEPDMVEGIATMYRNAGDYAGVARLYAHASRMHLNDSYAQQPIPTMTRQLTELQRNQNAKFAFDFFARRGYTPDQAAGIVGNLIHESGVNPTELHDRDRFGRPTGFGIAGWREERLVALRQFAKEKGTDVSDLQTQLEFIDRELHTTHGTALQALQSAKGVDAAAAAFIHFEKPLHYDPNNLSVAHGYTNRLAQARAVLGLGGVLGTGDTPASAAWLQLNRGRELNRAGNDQFKTIVKDYDQEGIRPSDKTMFDLIEAAKKTGDAGLLEDINQFGTRINAARELGRSSVPLQQYQISELGRHGAEGNLSPGERALKKDLERTLTAVQNGLEKNPQALASTRFGDKFDAIPPLDFAHPETIAANLQERDKRARFLANNYQHAPLSALDEADIKQGQAILEGNDVDAKTQYLGALTSNLSEDVRNATLTKLGEKEGDVKTAVAAGALMRTDPALARSILVGQNALKTDKDYLPKDRERQPFEQDLAKLLPADLFSHTDRTRPDGAYATMKAAVLAHAAEMAATAGDTTGVYSSAAKARLKQAIDDVTGGTGTMNGSPYIVPRRGMTEHDAERVIYSLTDQDFAGVTSQGGEPITAQTFWLHGHLESIRQGQYLVRFNTDASKPPTYAWRGYTTDTGDFSLPQRFVLDLRNRAGAPLPASGVESGVQAGP